MAQRFDKFTAFEYRRWTTRKCRIIACKHFCRRHGSPIAWRMEGRLSWTNVSCKSLLQTLWICLVKKKIILHRKYLEYYKKKVIRKQDIFFFFFDFKSIILFEGICKWTEIQFSFRIKIYIQLFMNFYWWKYKNFFFSKIVKNIEHIKSYITILQLLSKIFSTIKLKKKK